MCLSRPCLPDSLMIPIILLLLSFILFSYYKLIISVCVKINKASYCLPGIEQLNNLIVCLPDEDLLVFKYSVNNK